MGSKAVQGNSDFNCICIWVFGYVGQELAKVVPTGGLEPPIFGLGDRRLIHWATRAYYN